MNSDAVVKARRNVIDADTIKGRVLSVDALIAAVREDEVERLTNQKEK